VLLFILFCFCLIVLARPFNTVLNSIGKSNHPCLVLDLSGKVCSLSSLITKLDLEFCGDIIKLSKFTSIPSLLNVFFFHFEKVSLFCIKPVYMSDLDFYKHLGK
jgi:hypothetical protein